jgi:hypothetical protein
MNVHFAGTGPNVQKVRLTTPLALGWMRLVAAALILERYRKHRMAALCAGERYMVPLRVGSDFNPEAIHDQIIGDFHLHCDFCRTLERSCALASAQSAV